MGWIARAVMVCVVVGIVSCGGDRAVRTQDMEKDEPVEGNVDVHYYGGETGEAGDEAVIMDVNGDGYQLEPLEPGEGYFFESNVPAREALTRAQRFLEERRQYRIRLKRLTDEHESTIGYEVVPQPDYFRSPVPNAVSVFYRRGPDGKIRFDIRFLPLLERAP